jgi:hypothetical protein
MNSEQHELAAEFYTVKEIARRWKLSDGFVRDIFRDHPEVMRFPRPETRRKRPYMTLRIPHRTSMQVEANHTKLRPKLN